MTPQARGVQTRKLYRFESCGGVFSAFAEKPRTLKYLQGATARVWAAHGRAGSGAPSVGFGAGIKHDDYWVSYCRGRAEIVLAPKQRSLDVLLHELTHALGYGNPHGPGFVNKYFDLLVEYGRCSRDKLVAGALAHGLRM